MECSLSNSQPKRKRLLSVINVNRPVRRYHNQSDYRRIFESVLKFYLEAKLRQPYGSSFVLLDSSLRSSIRRWTPDTAHTIADFENAAKHALKNAPELQANFDRLFLDPENDRAQIALGDMPIHNRIVQKCAREFLRRGMFPIAKWFQAKPRQDFKLRKIAT